jgi:hypothetical protein
VALASGPLDPLGKRPLAAGGRGSCRSSRQCLKRLKFPEGATGYCEKALKFSEGAKFLAKFPEGDTFLHTASWRSAARIQIRCARAGRAYR